jgi:hypothetical protein
MHVLDKESGKLLNYRQLLHHSKYSKEWSISFANEFGRLAQGVGGRIKNPTNIIRFIREDEIPKERRKDVTYGSFVCTVRPEKAKPNRTRFTVGGNKINYPGEAATPTAEMLAAKILFNSIVSTPGAKFMSMDVSNFHSSAQNISESAWSTYPTKSSTSTNYATKSPRMVQSTSKLQKECMDCHRQASSPTNYSKKDSTNTDTIKANSSRGYGNMSRGLFNSLSSSMISASNTSDAITLSISNLSLNNTTK